MQHYRSVGADRALKYALSREERRLAGEAFAKTEAVQGVPAIRELLVAVGHPITHVDVARGCREIGLDPNKYIGEADFIQLLELLKQRHKATAPDPEIESMEAYAAVVEGFLRTRREDEEDDTLPISSWKVSEEELQSPEDLRKLSIPQQSLSKFCEGFGLVFDAKELLRGFSPRQQLTSFDEFRGLLEAQLRENSPPKPVSDAKSPQRKGRPRGSRDSTQDTDATAKTPPSRQLSTRLLGSAARGPRPELANRKESWLMTPSQALSRPGTANSTVPTLPATSPARTSLCTQPGETRVPESPTSREALPFSLGTTQGSHENVDPQGYSLDELDPEDRAILEEAYRKRDLQRQKSAEERKARQEQLKLEIKKMRRRKHRRSVSSSKQKKSPSKLPDTTVHLDKYIARMQKARDKYDERRQEQLSRLIRIPSSEFLNETTGHRPRRRHRSKSPVAMRASTGSASPNKTPRRIMLPLVSSRSSGSGSHMMDSLPTGSIVGLVMKKRSNPNETVYVRLQARPTTPTRQNVYPLDLIEGIEEDINSYFQGNRSVPKYKPRKPAAPKPGSRFEAAATINVPPANSTQDEGDYGDSDNDRYRSDFDDDETWLVEEDLPAPPQLSLFSTVPYEAYDPGFS